MKPNLLICETSATVPSQIVFQGGWNLKQKSYPFQLEIYVIEGQLF